MNFLDYVLTIIGFVLAYVFYRRSRRSKEPCWSVRNNVLIEGYSSKVGKLDIRFKDEQVENLSIARIAFWNQGAETLDRHDIETINPLRIEADEEIEILDVSVSLTNSSSSQFETELVNDRKSAKLDFAYLDKGQGAIVQIIHTGIKESDIQIVGDIKSVKKIKRKDAPLPSIRSKREGGGFIVAALVVLSVPGFVLYKSTWPIEPSIGLFVSLGLFLLYGMLFLTQAISSLRRGLPNGLESFENEPLL